MQASSTTHGLGRTRFLSLGADVPGYKSYTKRKWRYRLARVVLWGTALGLAIAIVAMLGSQ